MGRWTHFAHWSIRQSRGNPQQRANKALHPTAYSSARRSSSLRFRRRVSLVVVLQRAAWMETRRLFGLSSLKVIGIFCKLAGRQGFSLGLWWCRFRGRSESFGFRVGAAVLFWRRFWFSAWRGIVVLARLLGFGFRCVPALARLVRWRGKWGAKVHNCNTTRRCTRPPTASFVPHFASGGG